MYCGGGEFVETKLTWPYSRRTTSRLQTEPKMPCARMIEVLPHADGLGLVLHPLLAKRAEALLYVTLWASIRALLPAARAVIPCGGKCAHSNSPHSAAQQRFTRQYSAVEDIQTAAQKIRNLKDTTGNLQLFNPSCVGVHPHTVCRIVSLQYSM